MRAAAMFVLIGICAALSGCGEPEPQSGGGAAPKRSYKPTDVR